MGSRATAAASDAEDSRKLMLRMRAVPLFGGCNSNCTGVVKIAVRQRSSWALSAPASMSSLRAACVFRMKHEGGAQCASDKRYQCECIVLLDTQHPRVKGLFWGDSAEGAALIRWVGGDGLHGDDGGVDPIVWIDERVLHQVDDAVFVDGDVGLDGVKGVAPPLIQRAPVDVVGLHRCRVLLKVEHCLRIAYYV